MNIFFSNRKSYALLLLATVVFLAAGWLTFAAGETLPFTARLLDREYRRLDALQANIVALRRQNLQLTKEISPLTEIRNGALTGSRDVAAEKLREIVEQTAAESGLTIRSLREIQYVPAAQNWNICTLGFAAECSIDGLQNFLIRLEKHIPRLYWRNITLRPDNSNSPSRIILDGQIALLHIPREEEE